MKKLAFLLTIPLLIGCGQTSHSIFFDEKFLTTIIADFNNNALPNGFSLSHNYSNNGMFTRTFWSKDNVTFQNGEMSCKISENPNGPQMINGKERYQYLGTEIKSHIHYNHGNFSVKMKPAKVPGTVSSFFAYTGPSFDHDGDGIRDVWDEIDIEFLGKDTTKVQFNYFTVGEGGHEYLYDLGFDASEEYHEYGFRWEETRIIWFVDGKAVHEATENIPTTPMKMFANVWVGNDSTDGWLGTYNEDYVNSIAYYDDFGYQAIE